VQDDSPASTAPLDAIEEPLPEHLLPKPRLRGWFHQVAFILTIPAGVVLFSAAPTTAARVGSLIYSFSLAALYGVSATYHRRTWSATGFRWMRRLDHATIYLLIAGSATPVALLGLAAPWSAVALAVVWAGAALGITLKLLHIERFKILTGTLYIVLGWVLFPFAPQLLRQLSSTSVLLILIGGVLYTGGAVVLALNKPNPAPATFGYHEIWHSMVIAASACHYIAVFLLVLTAGGLS
jgi:hemolysin III